MKQNKYPPIDAPTLPTDPDPESHSSPIRILKPRAWLALLACFTLALGIALWSTLVQIPITTTNPAIMLINGSVVPAITPQEGRVVMLEGLTRGDEVKQGQVVAKIATSASQTLDIKAPIEGTLMSFLGSPGSVVTAGQPIAVFEWDDGPVIFRSFLDTATAQQLTIGSESIIDVALEGGKRVKFSTRVSQVGAPVTEDQAATMIGDQALSRLAVQHPVVAPVEMTIDEEKIFDQLQEQGIDEEDDSETLFQLVDATFIIGSKHPISYIFGR